MTNTAMKTTSKLDLKGLNLGAPQVLGGVRIVPVLRKEAPGDLRLSLRKYGDAETFVRLDSKTTYYSHVPHALQADWTNDGDPVVSFGSKIKQHKPEKSSDGKIDGNDWLKFRFMSKMRAREQGNRLRFLPMHLAIEGFLSLHFGGPKIAWEEYSREALKSGLGSRSEITYRGRAIVGLEDALRVFELHEEQVGVLIFVADAMAAAFVVSNPNDYRQLHDSLLLDCYGELITIYGALSYESCIYPAEIDPEKVASVLDLRSELQRVRNDWSRLHEQMAHRLLDQTIRCQLSYNMGPFRLEQFITDLDLASENHIGERIVRHDGTLEYLKTYRLSTAQSQRAYLLMQLAECEWNLDQCAVRLKTTKPQLLLRLEKAGFGYLLHQHVLDAARKQING